MVTHCHICLIGIKKKVRLYGIDAPEKSQPEGEFSADKTKEHISSALSIWLEVINVDMYQREVGIVIVKKASGTFSLNEALLLEGAAAFYPNTKPVSNSYKFLEQYAKENRLGIWKSEEFILPWEWRKK